MSTGSGYSLWLVPAADDPVGAKLQELILQLSAVFTTPTFRPHVTLLNDLEVDESPAIALTERLVQGSQLLPVTLGAAGSNHKYFQMLFLPAELGPELKALRQKAEIAFGVSRPYFPHLSLAYGDLSQDQVVELQREVETTLGATSGEVKMAAIELWLTNGPISDWRLVSSHPLGTAERVS